MEWLKDKKNLSIVVALAVFFFIGAAGLIAWELGLFNGHPPVAQAPTPTVPVGVPPGGPGNYPPGGPPVGPGGYPRPGGYPGSRLGAAPGIPRGIPGKPAAVPKITANNVQPLAVRDPFQIPNGAKKLAQINNRLAGPKLPLRDLVGPLNLFRLRPPAPPPAPNIPGLENGVNGQADPAANYRLSGVITGTDGINAILEVGGQSQSVKPGDSLPDGSRVQNIQTNSITLRTAGGAVINLPLSAGAPDQGTYNQGTFNQGTNGFNGPTPYQPGGYNGPAGPGGPPQFGSG